MKLEDIREFAERYLAAVNSCEIDRIAGFYTEDVAYRAPGTRQGGVHSWEELRGELLIVFDEWDMNWKLEEAIPLDGREGFVWQLRCSIKKRGGSHSVGFDALELLEVEDGRISRQVIYYDRVALAPLFLEESF